MEDKEERWGKVRAIGAYIRSGKWEDYWRTKISCADPSKCLVRGYPLHEIIENLSYPEVLYLTLRGELPDVKETRVLNALLCAIVDHQLYAAATPAARFVASGFPESPIPGIAAGILSIGSFTGSPQISVEFINNAYDLMKRENLTKEETAKIIVNQYREAGKRIPGFGHPLYNEIDPRARALYNVAKEVGFWGEKAQLYEAIHEEFVKSTGKTLPINVDGMMAVVGLEMGFDPMEIAGIATISFMCGIIAHVIEEIKEGVPLRIIPPELGAKYIGTAERHFPKKEPMR